MAFAVGDKVRVLAPFDIAFLNPPYEIVSVTAEGVCTILDEAGMMRDFVPEYLEAV